MAWSPLSSLLGSINERELFNYNITYYNELTSEFEPVTITASTPDSGVTVSSNTLSGQFLDAFDELIQYRTKQDTFVEVYDWAEINRNELYGVYYFRADTTLVRTYTYTATSTTSSQTYTIDVENDWDYNKLKLLQYVNPSGLIVTWKNNSNTILPWNNDNNETVGWET